MMLEVSKFVNKTALEEQQRKIEKCMREELDTQAKQGLNKIVTYISRLNKVTQSTANQTLDYQELIHLQAKDQQILSI